MTDAMIFRNSKKITIEYANKLTLFTLLSSFPIYENAIIFVIYLEIVYGIGTELEND